MGEEAETAWHASAHPSCQAGAGLLTLDWCRRPCRRSELAFLVCLEASRRCFAAERSIPARRLLGCEQRVPEVALVLGREPGVGDRGGSAPGAQGEQPRPRPERGN